MYGLGNSPPPHIFYAKKSMALTGLHPFTDASDLDADSDGFKRVSQVLDGGYFVNNGKAQFYSNWHVVVQKPT